MAISDPSLDWATSGEVDDDAISLLDLVGRRFPHLLLPLLPFVALLGGFCR
jgi:hypothetical protein